MEPVGDEVPWGGAIAGIADVAALAAHLLVGALLVVLAHRLGRARGGPWRHAIWGPIFAVSLPLCGTLATITWIVAAFGAVASADAASRATMLARGIAEGMNLTAFSFVIAWALYLAAGIAIAIGRVTAPRAPR